LNLEIGWVTPLAQGAAAEQGEKTDDRRDTRHV
jgi:hypothetical protein